MYVWPKIDLRKNSEALQKALLALQSLTFSKNGHNSLIVFILTKNGRLSFYQ